MSDAANRIVQKLWSFDPACGTGGFLLAAHEYLKRGVDLDRDQKRHLRFEALRGVELVPNVARLCGMNLYLHGIGPAGGDRREPPITTDDALRDTPGALADVVITDTTSNKQLNFVQHVKSLLTIQAGRWWSCRTTCCSKAEPARRCAATCCASARCTPCCACRPASSTRRA